MTPDATRKWDDFAVPIFPSSRVEGVVPGAVFKYIGKEFWFGTYVLDSDGLFESKYNDCLVPQGLYTILSVYGGAPGNTPSNPLLYTFLLHDGFTAWYRFKPEVFVPVTC